MSNLHPLIPRQNNVFLIKNVVRFTTSIVKCFSQRLWGNFRLRLLEKLESFFGETCAAIHFLWQNIWVREPLVHPDSSKTLIHNDVIKWKHFPCYWSLCVRGMQRSSMDSPHKGQWCGALMFSLICASINSWVNNREAGDLRRHRAHNYVFEMYHTLPVFTSVNNRRIRRHLDNFLWSHR